MDLLSEMPVDTKSGENLRLVASKFDPGMMAPLTVVLESDTDLRRSEGLALIDDVSRLLVAPATADRGSFGDPAAGKSRAAQPGPAGVAAG